MDSDQIREEIKRKIKIRVEGETPPPESDEIICDVAILSDDRVKIVCGDADFIIFTKRDDETTKRIIDFMKVNELSFYVVDIDSKHGKEMEVLIGISTDDLPVIFSAVTYEMVYRQTCPKTIEDLMGW